jgi:hypothetical protein
MDSFKQHDEADDIFASLGGSLMQELLADLNDDGDAGWLSLEQLEKELAHLDVNNVGGPPASTSFLGGGGAAAFPTTAASLVVSAQQQMANTASSASSSLFFPGGVVGVGGPPGLVVGAGGEGLRDQQPAVLPVDAWSLSLQKFTEASLEADFLQADSARKQTKKTTTTVPAADSLFAQLDLSAAEEYNLAEPIRLAEPVAAVGPPPGLVAAAASTSSMMMKPDIVQQVASRLEHEQQIHKDDVDDDDDEPLMVVPMRPKPAPPTPQNSMGMPTIFPLTPQASSRFAIPNNIPKPPPPTPQNSVTIINNQVYTGDSSRRSVAEPGTVLPPANTTAAAAAAAGAKEPTPSATAATSHRNVVVPPTPANSMHNTPQQPVTIPAAPAWQQPVVATPVVPCISGPNDIMGPVLSPSAQSAPGVTAPPPIQQPPPQAWGQSPVMGTPTMMIPPGHHHHPHQPQQQQVRRRVVYANPHPNAPPIPATALSSKYMSTRDISYVIHAILKPILLVEQQRGRETDYDQAYWRRHVQGPSPAGGGLGPYQKKGRKDMHAKEMESRHQKAKEWSSEHAVLGQTAKTNVTRPRALIAQPRVGKGGDDEAGGAGALTNDQRQRLQRQALWKARIYCDQAYQAYSKVVEMWRTASAGPSSPSGVPPGLQPHLVKLLKCLGITSTNKITTGPDGTSTKREKEYHSDEAVLALQMKLPKGRVLLARVLEQALLPPPAVQVLLPTALKVSYESKTTSGQDDDQHQQHPHQQQHDPVDDRLFAAWTRVVQHLPNLSGSSILQAMHIVQTNAKEALRTTCRMQMVHALLQRGGQLAGASAPTVPETDDPAYSFAPKWKTVESDFMNFLEGGGVSA